MAFCISPTADKRLQLALSVFQSFLLSKTNKITTVLKANSYFNATIDKKMEITFWLFAHPNQ